VKHAYECKKFAFVSDYARLKALHEEGGFYMDTDIELFKSLDFFRHYRFIAGIEYFPEFEDYKNLLNEQKIPKVQGDIIPYLGFLSAVMGAEPGNEIVADTIKFYDSITPEHESYPGTVIDGIMAREAVKYGFVYSDEEQLLQNRMHLIPSSLFCSMPGQVTDESYLLHHCAQSWQPKTRNQQLQLQLDKIHLLSLYKKLTGLKKALVRKIK
jgi:hypothetical protein